MRSHFIKSLLLALTTLFAVHIAYHLVQFVILYIMDFRPVELYFQTTWFEPSLDPRAWSKKRILAVYGGSTIAMFSLGISAKVFTPSSVVEIQDKSRVYETIYSWVFIWSMVYGLADVFAAPFIKNSTHVATLQNVYLWYFQGGPIESIAYVIAIVGMPFLIFIPMSSLRQFLGTSEFPQDLVFWAGRINVLMNAVILPGLIAHSIIIGLLYILPKYSLDDLIAFEMFRFITSSGIFLSFVLLSGLNRSGMKNKDYALINLSTAAVSLITMAVIFGILVLGIQIG